MGAGDLVEDLDGSMAVEADELVEGTDLLACQECLAKGDACDFHRGFAEGWDTCAAFIARHVEDEVAEAVEWLPPAPVGDESAEPA
jgi:hypothetical protein